MVSKDLPPLHALFQLGLNLSPHVLAVGALSEQSQRVRSEALLDRLDTALLKFWSARKFPETNARRTRERGDSLVLRYVWVGLPTFLGLFIGTTFARVP